MAAPLIREAAPDDPRLLAFVMDAAAGFAHDFERVRADLMAGDSAGFLVWADGVPVAGFVLGHDDGFVVVQAAAGRARFDLVAGILPEIEAAAAHAGGRGVRVETYRRGLVEKLGRADYQTQFVTMAKVFQ